MSKRRIKPKIVPGFEYEGPKIRRIVPSLTDPVEKGGESSPVTNHVVENGQDPDQGQNQDQVLPKLQKTINNQSLLNHQSQSNDHPVVHPKKQIAPSSLQSSPQQNSDTVPSVPTPKNNSIDGLLSELYTHKKNPSAYTAAVKKYIDNNYSLSIHKQRRKKFIRRPFVIYDPMDAIQGQI